MLLLVLTIVVGCGGKPSLNNMSARELFDQGMEKYSENKFRLAQESFQTVIYDYPGASLVDTAQYYLALSYFGAEDYILAQVEFNRLVNYYTSSVFVPHATFMRAVSFYESTPSHHGLDQSNLREALRHLEDFIIDYPGSELVADAEKYIVEATTRLARRDYDAAMTYYRMNALTAAEKYFQMVIDDYTGSNYAAPALYHLAEIDRKLEKFDEAESRYRNFINVYPDHDLNEKAAKRLPEMAFDAAMAEFDSGQMSTAKEKFERFLEKYPDHKRIKKAREFLVKIGDVPVDSQPEQASQES